MFPSCGFADGIQLYNTAYLPKSCLLYLLLVRKIRNKRGSGGEIDIGQYVIYQQMCRRIFL